jgi:hypothetical protein
MVISAKMSTLITRSRSYEDIRNSLSLLARVLAQSSEHFSCIVHCMQPHRGKFYVQLRHEFGVEVLLCSGDGILAKLGKSAMGVAALIPVDRHDLLQSLFLRVSEQATAALYVVSKSVFKNLNELARCSNSERASMIRGDPRHFWYQVDEDSATIDGLVLEIIDAGPECSHDLLQAIDGKKEDGSL